MQLPRRDLLRLAAGAAALPAFPQIAEADSYPSRPVHVLVGYAAGSASDIIARLMAQRLSEQLGRQFIVENRPGAATNLAAEDVARAKPDGYTLLLASSANTVNATLYKNLSFDLSTDIVPVALIAMSCLTCSRSHRRCRQRPWPSSSPTPKPIPARSIWRPTVSAPGRTSPANCSK